MRSLVTIAVLLVWVGVGAADDKAPSPAVKTATITFRVFYKDTRRATVALTNAVIKIGKSPVNHVVLDFDDKASRMHGLVEQDAKGAIWLYDLGSVTGTFLNGTKINKAGLKSGDTIVIGETRIEVAIKPSR